MGLIGSILGLGQSADQIGGAVERVAEVFMPNRTKQEEYLFHRQKASLDQFAREFAVKPAGGFDRFVNALNRLPRPILALGTVGLFIYAMFDPTGFGFRMAGLNTVPDPLWWLLGAIVSFYFGARELHYQREKQIPLKPMGIAQLPAQDRNLALEEWRKNRQ